MIDVDLNALLTDRLQQAYHSVPAELREMPEGDLIMKCKPTWVDRALRVSFWQEYEYAFRTKQLIRQTSVWRGVCENSYWIQGILSNPVKCAFLFRPVIEYQKSMETLLQIGLSRINEIMHLPIYNEKGVPNAKIAQVVLQAVKQVEDRVKGQALQRIAERSERVLVKEDRSPRSINEIDSKIKTLEAEINDKPEKSDIIKRAMIDDLGEKTRILAAFRGEKDSTDEPTPSVRDEVV